MIDLDSGIRSQAVVNSAGLQEGKCYLLLDRNNLHFRGEIQVRYTTANGFVTYRSVIGSYPDDARIGSFDRITDNGKLLVIPVLWFNPELDRERNTTTV